MVYDVYYTTGGGPWMAAGTDTWVNIWLEEIAPKLETKPILLIHRNKPKEAENYKFPIETHWHGDNPGHFGLCIWEARRIHILHGHYTPVAPIEKNKDKIYSNVLHNSVNHIIKSGLGSDLPFIHHPYMSSEWEQEVMKWSKRNIWIGVYPFGKPVITITNFYEFKKNLPLSESTTLGFAARPEGRKNPHYLDGKSGYILTDSRKFNFLWAKKGGIDIKKFRMYNFDSNIKDRFYQLDWGVSHSAFTYEPFGYSIFESVDYGKLPILHKTWCKDFEYKYRASTKVEFGDIYRQIQSDSYEERLEWFTKLKTYMVENFTDKQKWIDSFLEIYNG